MPRITLPDGSVRTFDRPVTGAEIAADIGEALARAAIGARVDDVLCDLTATVDHDARVSIVTAAKGNADPAPDALFLIRHSCAHVMAEAIQRVVPGVLLVYGPPVDTGFYYDTFLPEDQALSTGDFEAIEAEMAKIVKQDRPFTRDELPAAEGRAKLES